ncbi:hypothetical protein LMH87_011942 [Akanthomyces muscarius]|uniref:Trafficking protein particle complex subunit BET3 n=1 Tax=Akanthomyces muscarius TaxID=2231603 RepID=A0A9W8QA50_AKAMU|nr:hypothetical protein LMH87_011942 [Akanthomyces muscarius]KAJ4151229.1 hypothetical protein LMH87_011942 [Akanthomyces muscarius]
MASSKASRIGEEIWKTRIDKVNAELVTLTYGTVVAQLCRDFDGDYAEVNKQLDKMGYNIGLRLIEDYLAKSNTMKRCANFRETADMISRVGFKIFLNITPQVTNWTTDNKQFSLVFDENPFADFVELPDDGRAQDELCLCKVYPEPNPIMREHCDLTGSYMSGGQYGSGIIANILAPAVARIPAAEHQSAS